MVLARYSKPKMLMFAALWCAFIIVPFVGVLLMAFPIRAAVMALGDRKAIESDGANLIVYKFWGKKVIPWGEFANLEVQGYRLYYMGFIPLPSITYLYIRHKGGLFGTKKIRLMMSAMELNAQAVPDLERQMKGLGRNAGAQLANTKQHENRWNGPSKNHDPMDLDGAIARYMAKRDVTEAAVISATLQPPARPTFGRKAA